MAPTMNIPIKMDEKDLKKKSKIRSSSNNEILTKLIDMQKIDGKWSFATYTSQNNSDITNLINSSYKQMLEDITKLIGKDLKDFEDLAFTFLVLIILNQMFEDKKEEFVLIENKGKKYLMKNNIDYKKYLADMKLEGLF